MNLQGNPDRTAMPLMRKRVSLLLGLGLALAGGFIVVLTFSNYLARPRAASTAEYGVYDIPPDQYLCLEYWAELPDGGYLDFPYYTYEKKTLSGRISPTPAWATDKGFIGYGISARRGSGAYSFLKAIETLPATISVQEAIPDMLGEELVSPTLTIQAVDARGRIVFSEGEHAYALLAGESWTFRVNRLSFRFANYGLLDRSQITLW
jgi:hypothetical protein